ncbi:acyl-CoA thioesterase [Marinomonas algarum]|uniref:Acyl-CoA thioesterase n=1 Tax=Marinomonas algarum TaxID=2883105 RepID=A0A9X1IMB4_9GAMM|nr:acyl-CoA thioesterase [Marinomonas algarum]MCB5161917.1 acyl-CoA thioesterase [Marinomonas algarum]
MTEAKHGYHRTDFEVRDYECDIQSIVNNAVYQNYLEHARHQYIRSCGLNFADVTHDGIHLVLIKAELDYKKSLKNDDKFYIQTHVERSSRLKFVFCQRILRSHDDQLMLTAKMTVTSTTAEGRPVVFKQAEQLLKAR